MASCWMKLCFIVAFIIFAKCSTFGVGYPVAEKGDHLKELLRTKGSGCDFQVLKAFESKLVELLREVERLRKEERMRGFGSYVLKELSATRIRLTKLRQGVQRLTFVRNEGEEEGSFAISGSGLFEEKNEGSTDPGSAASCDPQLLKLMKSTSDELTRKVERLANARKSRPTVPTEPKPTDDQLQTTEPLLDQVCPHGWAHHGRSCYHVIDIPTLKWKNARTMCRQLDADLGKITTHSENQFIYNLLRKQKTVTHYGVWLGLLRKADMKFYWVDDTLLTGYTAWGSGEPNNNNGRENCVHKIGEKRNWPFRAGEWNDVPCDLSGIVPSAIAPVVLCQKQIDTDILSF